MMYTAYKCVAGILLLMNRKLVITFVLIMWSWTGVSKLKQNSNIRLSFDFKFVSRNPSQEDRIPT